MTRVEWDTPIPELRATCSDCIQARGPTAIYKNSLKCCTFFPFLPNFAVGVVLESDLPSRKWVEARLAGHLDTDSRMSRGEAVVTPLGFLPSLVYQRRFQSRQPDGYGNDASLLCPFYVSQGGLCGIWSARPSPCLTFFCESSYGLKGVEFWARFEKWLSFVELTLAREALTRLGFIDSEIALSQRFLPRYSAPDPHGYTGERLKFEEERSWLEFGSERARFFQNCQQAVLELNENEVRELLGPEGEAWERELLEERLPQLPRPR
jgi:Fe-S-cluster containining protein